MNKIFNYDFINKTMLMMFTDVFIDPSTGVIVNYRSILPVGH